MNVRIKSPTQQGFARKNNNSRHYITRAIVTIQNHMIALPEKTSAPVMEPGSIQKNVPVEERMHGATPVWEQSTPDSLISVAQHSYAVRGEVLAGVHPGPPQVPHSAVQHTSKDVDCTPSIPPSHWAPVRQVLWSFSFLSGKTGKHGACM